MSILNLNLSTKVRADVCFDFLTIQEKFAGVIFVYFFMICDKKSRLLASFLKQKLSE